ncbi:MAG: ribulose-phosphate 3-epimerase, partial [Bacillota bacterium]
MTIIAPSILSADFGRLVEHCRSVQQAGADWLHVDAMDGLFVPNITIGPLVVEALHGRVDLPLDVHLMIANPERYIPQFAAAGADYLVIHAEATNHLHRAVGQIKEMGIKAGVALNPHTPLSVLDYILPDLDMVLLMSVNPGFGGQRFIPAVLPKIAQLASTVRQRGLNTLIEVDGGINEHNAQSVIEAGATVLV